MTQATFLEVGELFPEFTLPTPDGRVSLDNFANHPAVVFFYPRDGSENCSIQVQKGAEVYGRLLRSGVQVLGISLDSLESHRSFAAECGAEFPLASDEADSGLALELGLIRQPSSPNEESAFAARTTFILDEGGRVIAILNGNPVMDHWDRVLSVLERRLGLTFDSEP